MPVVMNIVVAETSLGDVLGKAYISGISTRTTARTSGRLRVRASEALDGSSLNLTTNPHLVTFTVPRGPQLAKVRSALQLNAAVAFSADYATGESVNDAVVLVKDVNPLDNGDVEFTLRVSPGDAIVRDRAPG